MAFNANYNKSSRKNPTIKLNEGKDAVFGIYLAEVVSTKDVSRTGRCRVFIPAISKDKNSTAGYFDAIWTSPFAGSTDPRQVGKEITKPEESMSSYGFWAPVPDNGNLVLVAFGDGNTKYPLVISCLFSDKFNFAIPGNAGNKSYQTPNLELPVVEKNKRTEDINHNDTFRPINHTLAESIVKQGLAYDPVRGAGNSSARRESPSEVFGLLTPGPRDPDNFNYRLGGHSISLDDNLQSRNIRIRTAQGNQLLLDDTSGMIYMINRDGNVWWEMSQTGDMHVYAEGDINMRAKKNFNLRADADVNIEAGQNLHIKAAGDTNADGYVGEGEADGLGTIKIEAKAEMHQIAQTNTYQTSIEGEHHINSAGSFFQTTGDSLELSVASDTKIESGGGFSSKAASDIILETGAQIVEKGSQILMNSGGGSAKTPGGAAVAIPKELLDHSDNPKDPPEYDKESDSPASTNGLRQGESATVSSITTVMTTSEPWEGHGLPDPVAEANSQQAPDETIAQGFTPGTNGVGNSADVNSPGGFQQQQLDKDGKPEFSSPANVVNNFTVAKNKKLDEGILQSALTAQTNSIPPIRQPVPLSSGPNAGFVAGLGGKASQIAQRSEQMAFDVKGVPQDLQKADIAKTKNLISAATTKAFGPGGDPGMLTYPPDANGIAMIEDLQKQGITTINNSDELIFQDSLGNKLVQVKGRGMGEVGTQLFSSAHLKNSASVVQGSVNQSISDNQMTALTLFTDYVGSNQFASSKVLTEVNRGNYKDVPTLLLNHSSTKVAGKKQVDPKIMQRMQFYGELWRTPDAIKVPRYSSRVTFAKQARDLEKLRKTL